MVNKLLTENILPVSDTEKARSWADQVLHCMEETFIFKSERSLDTCDGSHHL